MSTLRTTNVIHGSSAVSNIVLDNQGRAIFGPDGPNGRASLYVNAQTNRVGVNTETPSVALDVDGAINATGNVAFGGTLDVTGTVSLSGNLGVGTSTPRNLAGFSSIGINGTSGALLDLFRNGTREGTLAVDSSGFKIEAVGGTTDIIAITNGSERLRILENGNVGINTSSPDAQLEIETTTVDVPIFQITRQDDPTIGLFRFFQDSSIPQGTGIAHLNTTNRDLAITTSTAANTTDGIYISTLGNLGLGTHSPYNASGYHSFTIDGTTGGQIRMLTGGVDQGLIYNSSSDFNIYSFGTNPIRMMPNGENVAQFTTEGLNLSPSSTTGIFLTNNSNTPVIEFKTNNLVTAARIRCPEDNGGASLEFWTKTGSDVLTQRLYLPKHGGAYITAPTSQKPVEYYSPPGRYPLNITGFSGEDTFIDIGGPYQAATGSGAYIRFRPTFQNVNSQAGMYVGGISTSIASTSLDFGRITCGSNTSTAASKTALMRFDNNGVLRVGTGAVSTLSGNGWYVEQSGQCNYRAASTGSAYVFRSGTSSVGSISVTTTNTAYNETSDYRVKENIVDLVGSIDRVKQLRPRQFNFIVEPEKTVDGFIAHETQEVVPLAVTGDKDAVDEDGNDVLQGIDTGKLIPLLTGALQEAIAKIEDLGNPYCNSRKYLIH